MRTVHTGDITIMTLLAKEILRLDSHARKKSSGVENPVPQVWFLEPLFLTGRMKCSSNVTDLKL